MIENEKHTVETPAPAVRCNVKYACPIYWTGAARSWTHAFVLLFIIALCYWSYSLFCSFHQRAHRLDGINRLKQIGIGFHNCNDTYLLLPKAFTSDEKGRHLHSWRLSLLPFIESNAIYGYVRKEEPWDSEYNKQFHGYGFWSWLSPNPELKDTPFTRYQVIVGPGTPFDETTQCSLSDFERGLTNTLLVVESGAAVHWMSPLDLPAESLHNGIVPIEKGVQAIGSRPESGGATVLTADGGVRILSNDTSPKILIEMSRLKNPSQP